MATNLEIQEQISKLLAEQVKMLETASKLMNNSADVARKMAESISSINYRDATAQVQEFNDATEKAAESVSKVGSTGADAEKKIVEGMQQAEKEAAHFNETLTGSQTKILKFGLVGAAALKGMKSGFSFTSNLVGKLSSLLFGATKMMFNLGKAIITAPFKMLSALIKDIGGGSNELQQAIEDVRKEFGNLHQATGAATIGMAKSMKGELANTGLSVYRIFGNLAERLRTMLEYMKELGPLAGVLAMQLAGNAEAIGAYHKGLGLTAEGFRAVGAAAHQSGQPMVEVLREMGNYSLQLAGSFGLSAKEVSRDMGTMMADFAHFGQLSRKELAQTSVFARRLGIDIKALNGVIDKLDNFEDAAKSAAQLSQAFGLNINAIELMKAQNPADRIEMMRKAFFAAGRSVENMSRQELRLLASQTGLDEQSTSLAFSLKNQGMSYAEVQKKGESARKHQLSQTEVLNKLAGAIERLVKGGGGGMTGFFDQFLRGFQTGIKRSSEFRGLMRNLTRDLHATFRAGMQVGRMFTQTFPGVSEFIGGLRDAFDPANFRQMLNRVVESFRNFFETMKSDPKTALTQLLKDLNSGFFDWFKGNSPQGQRILGGMKSFFKALAQISGSLLKNALVGVTRGIQMITDVILHPREALARLKGTGSFAGELISPFIEAFASAGPALLKAIGGMLSAIWGRIKEQIGSHWLGLAMFLFGPSITGSITRAVTAGFGMGMLKGIMGALKPGGQVATKASSAIGQAFQRFMGGAQKASQAAGSVPVPGALSRTGNMARGAIAAADGAADAASKSRASPATVGKLLLLGLVIGVGIVALIMGGILPLARAIQESKLTVASIAAASITMLAASTAMVGMAGAFRMLQVATSGLNAGAAARMALGVVAIGLVAAGMAWEGKHIINYLKDIKEADLKRGGLALAAISGFFIAASVVALAATVIGAIALAGGGLGAVAILAGITILGVIVSGMTVGTMQIMRTINAFRPSPGFTEKTKAFASILTAVGSFAANIAQIVSATSPGITGLIGQAFFGQNPQQEMQKTLGKVTEIINALGGQIVNIITVVQRVMNSMNANPAELRKAEVIGTLLAGVSSLAEALRPSTEVLQEAGWFAQLNGDTVGSRVAQLTVYVMRVSEQMKTFLGVIANTITGSFANGITDNQKRAVEVIPGLLKGIGELAQALLPRSTTLEQLNKSRDFAGALSNIGNFMKSLLTNIVQTGLFEEIGGTIAVVATALTSSNMSPRQLEALKAGLPALSAAFGGLGNIAMAIANLAQGNAAQTTGNIFQATQFVTTLMTSLSGSLPVAIRSMATAFSGIGKGQIAATATAVTAMSQIMETVSHINLEHVPSTKAITDMVAIVNSISRELTNIQPIRIQTGLHRLAANLGMGSNERFTITNRNFTIQVNLDVHMDSEELERTLIDRPNTRINHRDRT